MGLGNASSGAFHTYARSPANLAGAWQAMAQWIERGPPELEVASSDPIQDKATHPSELGLGLRQPRCQYPPELRRRRRADLGPRIRQAVLHGP